MSMDFWQTILEIRSLVSKDLEALRANKTIGSSLDADVTLFVDAELKSKLELLQEELRFVLITSEATVDDARNADSNCEALSLSDGTAIKIKTSASTDEKCVRCWHHRNDVGQDKEHPELCGRCVENVAGDGEPRSFA